LVLFASLSIITNYYLPLSGALYFTMSKNKFRIIIISSLILAVLSAGFDFLFPNEIIASVNEFIVEIEPDYSDLEFYTIMGVGSLVVIAVIFSLVGILMFKSWARHLYIASYILVLPIYFTGGLYVSSGFSQAMYDLSMILSGVIIALMYFSPVKDYFVKPNITSL